MLLALGADHAGYALKKIIGEHLVSLGHDVLDLGTNDGVTSVDWPDFGAAVGRAVAEGDAELGICVCGSGIGIAIAANKIPGVRAATVTDVTSAHLCREHNHVNVICFGARLTGEAVVLEALEAFLTAVPGGDRHLRRVEKLSSLEASQPTP
ncbi:MAG: RpiB/LacA/LacB family sugar-phosphate isomerase [Actinomycetota bacterium]